MSMNLLYALGNTDANMYLCSKNSRQSKNNFYFLIKLSYWHDWNFYMLLFICSQCYLTVGISFVFVDFFCINIEQLR